MAIIKASNKVQQPALKLDKTAATVVKAWGEFDKASAKLRDVTQAAFQHAIDSATVAGVTRDEAGTKHLMATIRGAAPFVEAISLGMLERKTVTEYAQSAGRAFFHGVPFTANLKNEPDMALPWSKAKPTAEAEKAGAVTSTSREALDQTGRKWLQQARLLGLTGLAADTLDLWLQTLDGFTETVDAK